ncbi:MAG TPA: thiamine diphosphokinase [Verrucomicrobia bacterium]|nr:thiamine diphosphokinase [Verrucomicrobiota bacterium]
MSKAVILANGAFPTHPLPRSILHEAYPLVCCDGAINRLMIENRIPDVIIGDLDSISPELRQRFGAILIEDPDQETNDLTKAVNWCLRQGIETVSILGATGEREDHTLANIALLARYNRDIHAEMVTDHGTFRVVYTTCCLPSIPGQQVSLFSMTPETAITSTGLKYSLNQMCLWELWQGSLNEATDHTFKLDFAKGCVVVFQTHPPH